MRKQLLAFVCIAFSATAFAWIAPSAKASGIYWTNGDSNVIGRANLDGTDVNYSFITANNPFNIAIFGPYIYWDAGASDAIGRMGLDGNGMNENFLTGMSPSGIAVDGNHIYWGNFFAGTIGRANLDGTDVNQNFVSIPDAEVYGVAIDATYIYWTSGGVGPHAIGRAKLDGTDVNPNFIPYGGSGVNAPIGIAVDGSYIYWTEIISGSIGRATLDGTVANKGFITRASLPTGVAVDGTYIYWTNSAFSVGGGGAIGRANLDGTGVNQNFITGIFDPWGVAVSKVSPAVAINWVSVGNPFNPPDTASNCAAPNCGSVSYNYQISKYDITNAQYVEFLNANAASDPNSLYDAYMGSDPIYGGITQSGSSGSYTYTVKPGFANKPVTYVSFWSALRFANWLNNGQGTGDTETGAYTITADGIAANSITRNPSATVFLPSENEWYKAAYYNPATSSYFAYPTGSNTPTVCSAPGATPNTANCGAAAGNQLTDVGAYAGSASPYGTFDQGGDVYQWNEQIMGSYRGIRGGFWGIGAQGLAASYPPQVFDPAAGGNTVGFRVAAVAADLPSGCGMGGEVALALPLLMWLRSRRRVAQ